MTQAQEAIGNISQPISDIVLAGSGKLLLQTALPAISNLVKTAIANVAQSAGKAVTGALAPAETGLTETAEGIELTTFSSSVAPEAAEAVAEAAARARRGDGPTLLEFRTYRYKGHSMSDPQKYRSKEEVEEYKQRDPIEQVLATILENELMTEAEIEAINKKVKAQVEEAVKFAEESPWPDGMDAFKDVYVQEDYPFVME
jgi:pyruvate dehydrogenase E1 component alpha subunit